MQSSLHKHGQYKGHFLHKLLLYVTHSDAYYLGPEHRLSQSGGHITILGIIIIIGKINRYFEGVILCITFLFDQLTLSLSSEKLKECF